MLQNIMGCTVVQGETKLIIRLTKHDHNMQSTLYGNLICDSTEII